MQSLAVKYRPSKFEECVGQNAIVQILSKQIETNTIRQSYLFCGSSGSGKTTIARIFALEVNKYQDKNGNWCSSEPIEIDGASNSGVENVRSITENAQARSLDGKYKVFIIDECHALSNAAWQAFLKCIEEPPEYSIFIFCTTDPQKIPSTILNRCMRFNFTKVNPTLIKNRLAYICEKEGFTNYTDGIDYISKISKGQLRDAITLLETVAGYSTEISQENITTVLGTFSYITYFDIINAMIDGDVNKVLTNLQIIFDSGVDMKMFVENFMSFCLDLYKYLVFKTLSVTKIPTFLEDEVVKATGLDGAIEYYNYVTSKLLTLKSQLRNDIDTQNTITCVFIQITNLK